MTCKLCKTKPVIQLVNSKITLCENCFYKYIERKVKKNIRKYKLIENSDKKIGVAVSGGKDSIVMIDILNKVIAKRKYPKLTAVIIDEGVKNYSDYNVKFVKEYCKKNKIELKVFKFDNKLTTDKIAKKTENACQCCAILKRQMINKIAKKLKFDKIATGHNLDDEAQTILMNQFKRKMDVSARLGPKPGVIRSKHFVPRIKPLYFINEDEIRLYIKLKKFKIFKGRCPYAHLSYRDDVRALVDEFESKHAGTKNSIVNSFLEILPLLKKHYKSSKEINLCSNCGEPCIGDVCKACEVLDRL